MNPIHYLNAGEQLAFGRYLTARKSAFANATSYWHRLAEARERVRPVDVPFCAIFEDQHDETRRMKVLHPDPRCIAELMAGGIHPPIDAVLSVPVLLIGTSGQSKVVPMADVPSIKRDMGPLAHEIIIDYRRCHAETAPAMTMQAAVEWICAKDIPSHVWKEPSNRPRFAIIRKDTLPKTRVFRDAWRMSDIIAERLVA